MQILKRQQDVTLFLSSLLFLRFAENLEYMSGRRELPGRQTELKPLQINFDDFTAARRQHCLQTTIHIMLCSYDADMWFLRKRTLLFTEWRTFLFFLFFFLPFSLFYHSFIFFVFFHHFFLPSLPLLFIFCKVNDEYSTLLRCMYES